MRVMDIILYQGLKVVGVERWEGESGKRKMEGTAVTYLGQTVARLGESDGCG